MNPQCNRAFKPGNGEKWQLSFPKALCPSTKRLVFMNQLRNCFEYQSMERCWAALNPGACGWTWDAQGKSTHTKAGSRVWDELGDWDWHVYTTMYKTGLPRWCSNKESICQCRKCGFDPWVQKIPWRRKWQPALVFLPGEFHEQRSLAGCNP